MSASFLSASFFSVPKGAIGAAGAGFFSALIKSVDAWVSALAEKIPGIVVFLGNNSTMPAIRYDLVSEI